MALLKTIEYQTGVTANYWKLTFICLDYLAKEIRVSFDLYVSAQTRNENKLPIESKTFAYPLTEEFELRSDFYSLVKTTEPNEGSSNVTLIDSENC